jgi:hypothetical protein
MNDGVYDDENEDSDDGVVRVRRTVAVVIHCFII